MAFSTLSVAKCLRYLNLIHYLIWKGESRKRWTPKSLEDLHIRGMKHSVCLGGNVCKRPDTWRRSREKYVMLFCAFQKSMFLLWKKPALIETKLEPDMSILSQCTTSHCQCCYSQNADCVWLWKITLHALITSEMPQSPPLSHNSKWLQNRWGCVDIFYKQVSLLYPCESNGKLVVAAIA